MGIIGRKQEIDALKTALQAGRSILLEGPVGVGKTALACHVASSLDRTYIRIDGDSRYTEQKLVGTWDLTQTMAQGMNQESFRPGPLSQAMQEGSILLINELNRMPELVQNILLPALDEGLIYVPQLGTLKAKKGFAVIATQNPRDFVGTGHLSEALNDRLEWMSISYPSFEEELAIVQDHVPDSKNIAAQTELAIELIRLTRSHPKLKRGASVRAALSLVELLSATQDHSEAKFWELAKMALATRVEFLPGVVTQGNLSKQLDLLLLELKDQLKKKS